MDRFLFRPEINKSFGMTVHYPEQFANTKGTFYPRGGTELDTGIVAMAYFYVAMPKDKYNTLMTEEDSSEEDAKDLYNRTQEIVYVFSVDKGRGASPGRKLLCIQASELSQPLS